MATMRISTRPAERSGAQVQQPHPRSYRLGRLAVASLHAELVCAPKPGLVTPFDSGSHTDMDATTFMRSLFALRGYFVAMADAGRQGADFAALNRMGRMAEADMLKATGGVNTHRGAIFSLGLLTAAAGALHGAGCGASTGEAVCLEVASRWGRDLSQVILDPASNGQKAVRRYGADGAREQAAEGFPTLRLLALPALRGCQSAGLSWEASLCHTLMVLVAELSDTNLLHRAGPAGLEFARAAAAGFLDDGGAYLPSWRQRLSELAAAFAAQRLSPGGSADLLACSAFLYALEVR